MVNLISQIASLRKEGCQFIDMHHHSSVSDGGVRPRNIAKAFLRRNIGVCLTDHNVIRGSLYLKKIPSLFTIPSIEVTSKENKDVLVYFRSFSDLKFYYDKKFSDYEDRKLGRAKSKYSLYEVLDDVRDFNGFSVLAHPFAPPPKRSYTVLYDKHVTRKLNGIESHNFATGNVKKTLNFLESFCKPITAGSDSHMISSFSMLTAAFAENAEDFLEEIYHNSHFIYHRRTPQKIVPEWINVGVATIMARSKKTFCRVARRPLPVLK